MNALRAALLALAVTACGTTAPKPPSHPAPKTDFTQRYLDLLVATSPELASSLGLHQRDSDLDDRTLAGVKRTIELEKALLADVQSALAENADQTDLTILSHALSVDMRKLAELRSHERQPEYYCKPMEAIFLTMAIDYAPIAQRAAAALARIEKLPQTVQAARDNLRDPPRVLVKVGIDAAESAGGFFDQQRALLSATLPEQKARIDKAIDAAKGAYAGYAQWLKSDWLEKNTGYFAIGKPLFEFLVHEDYFVAEDADALHALGKRVFADTLKQLEETGRRIDPAAKSWSDVVARNRAHHPTADDLLPSYRREVERARKFLVDKDVVPFPPGDSLAVMDTPPFQRTTIQAAYQQPPPFDTKVTKGFFYVTPVEPEWSAAKKEEWLREHDHGDQVDTVVHEAYPGHHLQLSFARLHPSLLRRVIRPDIFSEGWGLYAEELMAELGYYTDEERMMQLVWTLVRAARVIIDVGLHTRGMSLDDAVEILTDEVHLEKQLAVNEVQRYAGSPTQPLSYLVGRERIFALRQKVREKEGASFSLKRFHADVLSRGGIAPDLLERELLHR